MSDPLAHFIVIGLLLFLAGTFYQSQSDLHRIVITPERVAQLGNDYGLQFGSLPDAATRDALIQRDVHDEILFRQGRALKLDVDDEIVRRRIVQKMQFLLQDLNPPAEPSDAALRAYYQANASHYATAAQTSFSHIFFSSDNGGDAAAEARARAVLAHLSPTTTRAPDLGDPFPDLYDFSAFEPEQVERLFGHTAFSAAVMTAPVGRWSGPFKSSYGWHLLYIDSRAPGALPPLSAIRDTVRSDYLQNAQDQANQAAYDKLARQFHVIRQDQAPR